MSTGEVIVEQLKKIGVTASIELIDWTTWLEEVYTNRNFEATVIGIDANLAPSDMMLDENEKAQYYHRLQELLAEDAAAVYIMDPPTLVAVNKKLTGFTFYPIFVQDMSTLRFQQ